MFKIGWGWKDGDRKTGIGRRGQAPSLHSHSCEPSDVETGLAPVWFAPSYGDEVPSYGDSVASYRDAVPSYGDEVASYGDEVASYGDEVASYGDEVPSYGDEVPSYTDQEEGLP